MQVKLLNDAAHLAEDAAFADDEDGDERGVGKARGRPLVQLEAMRLLRQHAAQLAMPSAALLCAKVVAALLASLPAYKDQELRLCGYELLMRLHDAFYDSSDAAPRADPPGAVRPRVSSRVSFVVFFSKG